MARTSDLTNLATVTRASKAWDPGAWTYQSGATVGALTEYAANQPRITARGLLIEGSATNLIRNPRFEGATAGVIGSGGAMPTYYTLAGSGYTLEVIGVGQESGWDYLELEAVMSSSGSLALYFDALTVTSSSSYYTIACGIKATSGDFSNLNTVLLRADEYTSVPAYVSTNSSAGLKDSIDANHRRFHFNLISDATATRQQPYIQLIATASGGTFRFRLYAPQMENARNPSSPVLPTVASPATSSRSADLVYAATGSWFNIDTFTIYGKAYFPGFTETGVAPNIISLTDGGSGNEAVACRIEYPGLSALAIDGGTINTNTSFSGVSANTAGTYRFAISRAVNDVRFVAEGASAAITDTTSNWSGTDLDRLILAGVYTGAAHSGPPHYLQELRFYPRQLADDVCDALVGN